jgi:cytochrome c oxidase subunit 4
VRTLSLFYVYLSLLLLLVITAGAAQLSLGTWGTVISLSVAAAKAVLVLWFFMQLYKASGQMRIVALGSLLWLAFLLAMTAGDYLTRGMIHVPGK